MLHFAWIFAFILLPLPILMGWRKLDKKPEQQIALTIPFYDRLVPHLVPSKLTISTLNFRLVLFWLIWLLYIIALAQPQWLGEPISTQQQGRNILLAVDISGSMQIPDMTIHGKQVDRLSAIKTIASEFITKRQGDKVGLILFGSKAYIQTPLTFDRQTVVTMLNDASIGLAGQMTAIGDAIGLAIKRLKDYPEKNRVLILLTDGGNNSGNVDALSAANVAKQYHIKIYTIGFGSEQAILNTPLGKQMINPSADLDETTLKKIAEITGGQYFRAKNSASLSSVYEELNLLEPINSDNKIIRPALSLYPWFLAAALLINFYLLFSSRFINLKMVFRNGRSYFLKNRHEPRTD